MADAWKFTHDGHVYREGDVTVDQWIEILEQTGAHWATISPFSHPRHARAIFSVIVSDRANISRDEAAKVIGSMSTDQFFELFERVEDTDDLPQEFTDGIPR